MSHTQQFTKAFPKVRFVIVLILFFILGGINGTLLASDIDKQIAENNTKAAEFNNAGNSNASAQLYNQNAYLLRSVERYSEAADYYQKVLDINTALGNRRGQMISHNSLAMVYLEAENFQKAIYHFYKELEYRKQINNKAEIINVLTNIALAENETSSFDSSIDNIEKAISLAKELNDIGLLKRCYGVAYDIYTKQGNNESKAREYFEMYSALDRRLKEQKMTEITTDANQKVSAANTEKQLTEQQLNLTSQELEKTVSTLQEAEELTREQKMELELNQAKINEQNALLETERLKRRYLFIGVLVLSLFVLVLSFMIHKINRANKQIEQQRQSLERQNKEITSSINYAQTIQKAMLPSTGLIEKFFEPFIMYMPKDIVSGDFYWISTPEDNKTKDVLFAMVDCTGHGVPGAFMSMIGNRLLNEIVNEKKITSPAEILETLNNMIREALRQEETDNNDGMDMALCRLEKLSGKSYRLTFSGAKRPLYVIRNVENKLIDLRGDRKSIGGYNLNKRDATFTNHEIEVEKGDLIYLLSDGITDQNNPERKKFGRIQLEEALVDCAKLAPAEQHKIIEERLVTFMENEEQRDDITLIGLKII